MTRCRAAGTLGGACHCAVRTAHLTASPRCIAVTHPFRVSLVCSCALRHDDFEREDFARFSCVSVMMHGAETHQLANVQRTEWYETCHEYRAHLNATERAEEAVHPL